MRCTSPRTVGFKADGKTICWSQKQRSKEFATFQLPCGKCIECRLDYARQWAVRCVHEAQMHPKNCFITLTYADEHLKSSRLIYSDFQKFMKKLRKSQSDPIGVFVTGEYGELTKRPHWHAILFNYSPKDSTPLRTTERGDRVYSSETLDRLWSKGKTELGSVTLQSAGYCARYAAKKLVHGNDGHGYEPISKKSSKHAIGKKWLEKYYEDFVNTGSIVLHDGTEMSVPRYYEKWLQKHKPQEFIRYVTEAKLKKTQLATEIALREEAAFREANYQRSAMAAVSGQFRGSLIPRNQIKKEITKSRFKRLQEFLKL